MKQDEMRSICLNSVSCLECPLRKKEGLNLMCLRDVVENNYLDEEIEL